MYDFLADKLCGIEYKFDVDLSKICSFRVGGNADVAVYPRTESELMSTLAAVRETPHVIIGGGTNVLISDEGYRGVVIFTKYLDRIKTVGNILICESGVRLAKAVAACLENNLSGLEFAVDIPGTVGGLVAMNGGCFNKSCEDVVCYVVTETGVYNKKSCGFSYRSSRFLSGEAIVKAAFKLKHAEEESISAKLDRFKGARSKNQPKGCTCGSVFLNDGYYAGKIIDQAGLKGFRIGGAYVSDLHANFIISDGSSAQDVFDLIRYVKKKVYLDFGIDLREEVRYLGAFNENRL
ncbi:MAG: UDP-N-acetylmuramate dehydrogenase [Clostridia bacterium]|nr:UDP-N-acetylmuramate dehydrogenase [Clostridia bacterium]